MTSTYFKVYDFLFNYQLSSRQMLIMGRFYNRLASSMRHGSDFYQDGDFYIVYSHDELSQEFQVTKRSISQDIQALKKAGLLEVQTAKHPGQANRYFFPLKPEDLIPANQKPAPENSTKSQAQLPATPQPTQTQPDLKQGDEAGCLKEGQVKAGLHPHLADLLATYNSSLASSYELGHLIFAAKKQVEKTVTVSSCSEVEAFLFETNPLLNFELMRNFRPVMVRVRNLAKKPGHHNFKGYIFKAFTKILTRAVRCFDNFDANTLQNYMAQPDAFREELFFLGA
ncbi:helix-turn-helix domain-containing protein [Ligilactobacillus equi]|uniref:HTH domain-containing protein n=1 Tax=Ligilactobacillus equi TaxID=137357 RepID=UPI002ECFED19